MKYEKIMAKKDEKRGGMERKKWREAREGRGQVSEKPYELIN